MKFFPKQEKFMRAVHPDPVEATGYPYGAMIVAKVGKDWGVFHKNSGMLVRWFKTRDEACAKARKIGHWPSWSKIKRCGRKSGDVAWPIGFMSRLAGTLRTRGIIPPRDVAQ